ncbi:hypothetical protein EBZ80_09225 [bacterium]|nr:hypothetical protein [bacterium]
MPKRKPGCLYDDPPTMKHRLAAAHKSARQATEYAGRLLQEIALLRTEISNRDRVIAALRGALADAEEQSLDYSRVLGHD